MPIGFHVGFDRKITSSSAILARNNKFIRHYVMFVLILRSKYVFSDKLLVLQ